jgi:hypothetical protein
MPLPGRGEGIVEQSSAPSWWVVASFLADPCATLASILPTEALIPSQEEKGSIEAWRQQLFCDKKPYSYGFLLSCLRTNLTILFIICSML